MRILRLFCCIFFLTSVPLFASNREIKAELRTLRSALVHMQNSRSSFLSQTVSNILSMTITGVVMFIGTKWLLDASRQKKTTELETPIQQNAAYTFRDLAGKIPKDVLEITEFIKDTKKYADIGARMPRGILLVGAPGTGKTSIARAIAGECEAYFVAISASEFIEMFVGNGPRRVRDLFAKARASIGSGMYSKAIIFIDELDSIGGARNAVFDAGGAEYRNTLNELLHQMDGFTIDDSIFILAATNREQDIDPALKRAGRFDRIVEIELPDAESREAILKLYARTIKLNKVIDFTKLAEATHGMSGAELKNVVNEAAIYAVRANAKEVRQEHFEQAIQTKSTRIT